MRFPNPRANPQAVPPASGSRPFSVVALGGVAVLAVLMLTLLLRGGSSAQRGGPVSLMAVGESTPEPGLFEGPPVGPAIALPPMAVESPSATDVEPLSEPSLDQIASAETRIDEEAASEFKDVAASGEVAKGYTGQRLRPGYTLRMRVTAYSPDARSCGIHADGMTASGLGVTTNGMHLVAADTDLLPFGTHISIPGYADGQPVPVLDRGGAIRGRRIDLLMPTHQAARDWGVQDIEVVVWEAAD